MHNCHEKRMNSNGCVSNDVGRRVEFDAIRVLATVFVVVFHFNCCFEKYGVTGFHQVMYSFANGDFGQLGVALFFMLSGESLIAKNKDEFNTLSFYKRRMKRILPAYYISWIYVYIYVSYVKGIYVPLQNLNWRMIFTFTVVDGWLWGITNTFFLVGEWFTGVLIILYLLFPVLRWIYNKHFIEGTLVIALIYCLNFRYKFLFFGDGWFSLSNGLMLFWLGMSIERYKAVLYKISPVILGIGCWVHFMISMPFNALIKNIVGGGYSVLVHLYRCFQTFYKKDAKSGYVDMQV